MHAYFPKSRHRWDTGEAIDFFRQALELDPDYVDAMAGIALARTYQVVNLYRLEDRDALLADPPWLISSCTAFARHE